MKQIYKKLLAAALGVSMLLSMVGCGQSDTSEQTQTDSEQTQAANENEAKVQHNERPPCIRQQPLRFQCCKCP